jgi:7-keto-8-aminopelargonate synthetase-like enzyme
VRERAVRQSRIYASSTPLPPPLAAAALVSLAILQEEGPERRAHLRANARAVQEALGGGPHPTIDRPGPMFAVAPSSARAQDRLRRRLLAAGIYPPLIRYAGGPADRFFRFAISTAHSSEHLARLSAVLMRAQD